MQRRSASASASATPPSASLPTISQSTTTTKRIKRYRPLHYCNGPILIILTTILSVSFFLFLILRLKSSEGSLQFANENLQRQIEALKEKVYIAESEKTNTEAELKTLQFQNDQLVGDQKRKAQEEEGMITRKEMEEMMGRDEILQSQVETLKKEVQSISKREVEEKFGPGPHRIKITLKFPSDAPGDPNLTSFTVELAPLDLMPHSVYLFLNWAKRDLLKGSSFHRNAGHVIQAGPTKSFANQNFKKSRLGSVSFQEYHPEFPHVKYTLGFAGRPGGPDWYVSMMDNTKNHGPGGQTGYALKSEADPCFGKVVEGFKVVDRVHGMEVEEGWYMRLKAEVEIEDATIL